MSREEVIDTPKGRAAEWIGRALSVVAVAVLAFVVAKVEACVELEGVHDHAAHVAGEKAESAAEKRLAVALVAAQVVGDQLEEAEKKLGDHHNENAEAVNACLDEIDDLSDDLDELTRDFDRLAGAVEAFHGAARTARVISAQDPVGPPVARARQKAKKVPLYQMAD